MAMHPFDRWMQTAGKRDAYGWEPTLALFDSFRRFCEATGEREGGIQEFSQRLVLYGLVPLRRKCGRGWRGISLREPAG